MVMPTASMLLPDTHVLIWLDSDDSRLGSQSRRIIDDAFVRGDLLISAISFLEAGVKVDQKKLALAKNKTVAQWRRELLSRGCREITMDGEIAAYSVGLRRFNRDPFDCVIAATAILRKAKLITADDKLLKIKARGLSLMDAGK